MRWSSAREVRRGRPIVRGAARTRWPRSRAEDALVRVLAQRLAVRSRIDSRLSEGGSESRQLWRWRASSGTRCLLAPAGRWRVAERSHFDVFVLGAQVEDGRSSEQTGP
jgi:hypothetical protein